MAAGLLDAKLVELAQLEQGEERRRLLEPGQLGTSSSKRESPAAAKHGPEALEEAARPAGT